MRNVLGYKLERNPKFFQAAFIKTLQRDWGEPGEDRDYTKPCTHCSAPESSGIESKFWCLEFLWTKSRCLHSALTFKIIQL